MARHLGISKFFKSNQSAGSLVSTSLVSTSPAEITPTSHTPHVPVASQKLPKVIKNTGNRIKKLFRKSKQTRLPLYSQSNDVFIVNSDVDNTIAGVEVENAISVERLVDSVNVVNTTEQEVEYGERIGLGWNDIVDQIVGCEPHDIELNSIEHSDVLRTESVLCKTDDISAIPTTTSGPYHVVDNYPRPSPQLSLHDDAHSKSSIITTIALPRVGNESVSGSSNCSKTKTAPESATPAESSTGSEADGKLLLDLYSSYTPNKTCTASEATINNGSTTVGEAGTIVCSTASGAAHSRGLSDATTLGGSTSKVLSNDEFRMRLQGEYQMLAAVQGDRDRRAVEEDRAKKQDQAIDLDTMRQHFEAANKIALEEQAKEYEALLDTAKNDSTNALAEAEDLHNDEVKYLQNDLESARSRKGMFEKRLKKVLEQQKTAIAENRALSEKCKACEKDIALKDEHILGMSTTIQSRQEELEALRGQYNAARTTASDNARLVEESELTIFNLRQNVQVLTGQLAQHQQDPTAALIDTLRNENSRFLGVIDENNSLMETATAKISALDVALRQAKRDHDRWFAEMPEHSLSSPTKIANHLAYKDKLYEELEKRFQVYTGTNEEEQKKARAYKNEAERYINSLIKALEMQNEAVNKAKKDKEAYLMEMSRILTTSLDQLQQDQLIKGLSFHFDLVQKDNFALATRVTEMDEEIDGLRNEVAGHEREQKDLIKVLEAQQETARELEEAKRTAMGEIDVLKYNAELAGENRKEEINNYQARLAGLQTELRAQGDNFAALNRQSADERVRYELNAKDNFIQGLRERLDQCLQAYIQACNDREHYKRVSEMDASLMYSNDCSVSFLQRQLCLSEDNYAKLQADLDDVHLRNARDRRLSKEALDEEKTRVQELEKELHELYRNLQARASQAPADTPADTPPRATSSEPAKEKSAAIEDLAGRLWSCLCGLEMAVGAYGIRVLDHDNEREAIRLACADLLGLEENGSPRGSTSVADAGDEDVGDNTPNPESDDNLAEEGTTDQDQAAQLQGDYALAEGLINDACDALSYAPDDPFRAQEIQRSVYGRSREVGVGEGSGVVETAPGLGSSTDAVVGEEDEQDGWEDVEDPVRDAGHEQPSQSSTDEESSTTTTTDGTESGSGHGDDKTVTQEQYDAAAVTPPQHAPALVESTEDTAGMSPTDEGDPDDSMEMTPGTWARRYAPPFMYGEPIEDDMF